MLVKLVHRTDDAEGLVLKMARVSSPNPESKDTKLLNYLIKHHHFSPFELVNMCVEINTSRDISAQIIRHRSFHFQEFSQRYSKVTEFVKTNPRRQDINNRQNSTDDLDEDSLSLFREKEELIHTLCKDAYDLLIEKGVAKECARRLLPMSSATKIYMNGTLRDWIHYINLRTEEGTQLEHREIVLEVKNIFIDEFPIISAALDYKK